eukprot:TRINITY_DN2465_c0_g1_i1.p3 TRINITY_DN2465_c0_g1~~TRINITY_DN2465_c0_g1_i1.p3  ORF type:complete len:157 (+),score=10.35 TRINITY_DN2465_c0_g1_i1:52-522(+)
MSETSDSPVTWASATGHGSATIDGIAFTIRFCKELADAENAAEWPTIVAPPVKPTEEEPADEEPCQLVATFIVNDKLVGVLANVDCGHIELLVPEGQDSALTKAVCAATEHIADELCEGFADMMDDGSGAGRDEPQMSLPVERFSKLRAELAALEQ